MNANVEPCQKLSDQSNCWPTPEKAPEAVVGGSKKNLMTKRKNPDDKKGQFKKSRKKVMPKEKVANISGI